MHTEWIPSTGDWWRATRYEVVDGVIRPASDSRIERYDPWALYRRTRAKGHEFQPPYADLTDLGLELSTSRENAEKQIVGWCRTYGLLGLLPHQVRMATLSPRWAVREVPGLAMPVPEQVQLFRLHNGWRRRRTMIPVNQDVDLAAPDCDRGQLVSRAIAPVAWARTGVIRQDLRSAEISSESVRMTFGRFFPGVESGDADDFPYPAPLSEEFWRAYGEPYDDFLDGLQCFAEAMWLLEPQRSAEKLSREDARRVSRGTELLNALLAPANATLVTAPGASFEQRWICGSLLSAFAMMALQDLAEGRHIHPCRTCSRLFVSQHPAARFCSDQCRWTSQKRRQREAAEIAPTPRRRGAKTQRRSTSK